MDRKSRITETVLIFNINPRLTDDETFCPEVEFLDRLVGILNDLYRAIRAVLFYFWPTENDASFLMRKLFRLDGASEKRIRDPALIIQFVTFLDESIVSLFGCYERDAVAVSHLVLL